MPRARGAVRMAGPVRRGAWPLSVAVPLTPGGPGSSSPGDSPASVMDGVESEHRDAALAPAGCGPGVVGASPFPALSLRFFTCKMGAVMGASGSS